MTPKSPSNPSGVNNDFASFVRTREDGEEIKNIIPHSYLDYRPQEPNWIQVKIGGCDKHREELQRLRTLIVKNRNLFWEELLEEAKR